MQEITLNNKKYLLVEVPDDAHDFGFMSHNNSLFYWLNSIRTISGGKGGMVKLEYNVNNLKLIGKVSDILKNEDICKELVEFKLETLYPEGFESFTDGGYRNYEIHSSPYYNCRKAEQSFLFYLQSINLYLTKSCLLIQKL
jgi:hypothetical protein